MKSPRLRAEAMILNEDHSKVLVQCDENESFYPALTGSKTPTSKKRLMQRS
ncbi:hypothetical protein QUG02_13330 [Bacillus hominis]|uniref:Uncharacterized protein n=1 Tax=Bacillus hominis TaxID=2817478 RepID=A0ABT7R823_9BACI|nr:hypothetical protein [Bacillus hominis]MDM5193950.1 hypothetical protein [Bacillus hominis]MDM5433658.1 hypothetical protein [Bacillus hominis]MDM5439081.1 hypothetical protein [Bacillus hominis]